MSGYVFLSNSTKPSNEEQNSRENVQLTNVSRPCLQAALDMGFEVFLGINRANPEELTCELPVKLYDSHTYRSITAIKDNIIAYINLAKIVKNNNIEVIHCNSPVGGMIGRLVGRKYHVKKIIYTAHGFHFYKGAPMVNRTLYKWAEQIMAHWTDVIITMNEEDYESSMKLHLKKGGKRYKVHGVGISLSDYEDIVVNRNKKRMELGLSSKDIVCIAAGDLVERKNYKIAIEAIAATGQKKLKYLICGKGPQLGYLMELAKKLRVDTQVLFLGFRRDIVELFKSSDIFLFSSLQEGLPRSLMEAMACGLPCVVSKIRGNVDLIVNGQGGLLCNPTNIEEYVYALNQLSESTELRNQMGEHNIEEIKKYDISVVEKEIKKIYRGVLT